MAVPHHPPPPAAPPPAHVEHDHPRSHTRCLPLVCTAGHHHRWCVAQAERADANVGKDPAGWREFVQRAQQPALQRRDALVRGRNHGVGRRPLPLTSGRDQDVDSSTEANQDYPRPRRYVDFCALLLSFCLLILSFLPEGHGTAALAAEAEIHDVFADATAWATNPMSKSKSSASEPVVDDVLPELPSELFVALKAAFVACDSMGRTDIEKIHLPAYVPYGARLPSPARTPLACSR